MAFYFRILKALNSIPVYTYTGKKKILSEIPIRFFPKERDIPGQKEAYATLRPSPTLSVQKITSIRFYVLP